ncbi:hypothetical protein [Nannocystis pusilla]|uniref:hypothetical protein n=1 Tax=Nannocystis pusilla TaxID=889268 RepID=UPI003B80FE43
MTATCDCTRRSRRSGSSLFISVDPPARNAELRERLSVPAEWPFLSDEQHRAADLYGIPISRALAKAHGYADGFIQPAVFVFRGEEELFTFVQRPSMLNLWGAARRPSPSRCWPPSDRSSPRRDPPRRARRPGDAARGSPGRQTSAQFGARAGGRVVQLAPFLEAGPRRFLLALGPASLRLHHAQVEAALAHAGAAGLVDAGLSAAAAARSRHVDSSEPEHSPEPR